jgi:protein-disulfide isomerase
MDNTQGTPPTKMFALGIVSGVLILCTIGFFILLGVMLKGGSLSAGSNSGTKIAATAPPAALPAPAAAPAGDVPEITGDDHVKGSSKAKVTLVEYSDFECPFCGRFFPTIKQVEADYGDSVRIVYRHFPLSFHPEATPAAEASECAGEQGKFWEFHDGVFEGQARIGSALYKEIAENIGLNTNKFNDCISSGKYTQKVIDQQNGGAAAGVGGTPHTIVLGPNGEKIPLSGALPYAQVKATIDSLL